MGRLESQVKLLARACRIAVATRDARAAGILARAAAHIALSACARRWSEAKPSTVGTVEYAPRARRLTVRAAQSCELATGKKCRCRCGGQHHGSARVSEHDARLCLLPVELEEAAGFGWQGE